MEISEVKIIIKIAEEEIKKVLAVLQEKIDCKRVNVYLDHVTNFDGTELVSEVEIEATY